MNKKFPALFLIVALLAFLSLEGGNVSSQLQSLARDPGVRGGAAGAGGPYEHLTQTQLAFFQAGQDDFAEADEVADGLGPTMNLDSCGGCHMQPAIGGSSPAVNPQVAFATKNGAINKLPPFITPDGPVREARFIRNPDGTPDADFGSGIDTP